MAGSHFVSDPPLKPAKGRSGAGEWEPELPESTEHCRRRRRPGLGVREPQFLPS